MAKPSLILVTNDDGVRARGIISLARRLKILGRVVVVAPNGPQSASSHSVTLHRPLRINRLARDVYSVDGTPADCVMLGVHEILDARPDLIVSGINHGANLGEDVHYSGTVSAAFEGGILGIPSIAVSRFPDDEKGNFSMAANFAAKVARKVLKEGLPRGVILNINVPAVSSGKIMKYCFTYQGRRNYGDIIEEKVDPRGRKYYWIGGKRAAFEDMPESDCNAVLEGRISITPLQVDLTDRASLKALGVWRL
ncbi:MAG: 5'/3'-nucleotidase SurE [Pseudomonadota bacterium]